MKPLTCARLRELLHYDPETGEWTRLASIVSGKGCVRHRVGDRAGWRSGGGYNYIGVDGGVYKTNRLAVLYMTGEWPQGYVDHRDRAPRTIGGLICAIPLHHKIKRIPAPDQTTQQATAGCTGMNG